MSCTLAYLKGNADEHRCHTYKQYYYVTHATLTHIPKVRESAGNIKITVSSLVNRVNSHLTFSKAFGYCILQIAYSSAVMWNRIEKHAGFGWLKMKRELCSVYCRTVVVISVCRYLRHIPRHGPTKEAALLRLWPHVSRTLRQATLASDHPCS